jgi:two-component system chemotaxis response regulator CheY
MMNIEDYLAEEYLAESREHLADFESDLIRIETGGAQIAEPANRLLRALRSIKRGAAFFDLPKIRDLANETEDVLELVRSGKMVLTNTRTGILLLAADRLQNLLRNPGASDQVDISAVMASLAALNQEQLVPERLRILLVEDDFASRLLLQTFLSRYGDCHIAVNGREAVAAFHSALASGKKYDLICMDIMMPVMDGQEAVGEVRATEEARGIFSTSGTKIIMTTAVTDIREVGESFRKLCDAYLTKPIDLGRLLNQMKAFHLVR